MARNGDVVPANQRNGKVFVTRFSTMSGGPLDRFAARACPARRSAARWTSSPPNTPAAADESRADSSIREPFLHAGGRVGRSPTAKRWAADRLGPSQEYDPIPVICRDGDVILLYQHDQKLFMT